MQKPSKSLVITWCQCLAIVLGYFLLVYFSSNHYASSLSSHHRMHFNWEMGIPLLPAFIFFYVATYLLPFSFLLFMTEKELWTMMKAHVVQITIAGLVFFAYPTILGFERVSVPGFWGIFFDLVHMADKPHNLFPSMHIVFATQWTLLLTRDTTFGKKVFWLFIWFMIALSVLFVHQHHILDILGGFVLAFSVDWYFFKLPYFNGEKSS